MRRAATSLSPGPNCQTWMAMMHGKYWEDVDLPYSCWEAADAMSLGHVQDLPFFKVFPSTKSQFLRLVWATFVAHVACAINSRLRAGDNK